MTKTVRNVILNEFPQIIVCVACKVINGIIAIVREDGFILLFGETCKNSGIVEEEGQRKKKGQNSHRSNEIKDSSHLMISSRYIRRNNAYNENYRSSVAHNLLHNGSKLYERFT